MRKHLLILLLFTVVTRATLFISYPMGGTDDDQSAQRFLVSELLHGHLMIGNLRYNTGYPLVIAPVAAAVQPFGRLSDRILLLVQIALASTIPFAIYDMVRSRQNAQTAFIVALVLTLDPFALQWAHFSSPVWLVAFCLAWGLWSVNRALLNPANPAHSVRWIAFAGLFLGVACLARWEAAVMVAVLGLTFSGLRSFTWRIRLTMFGALGAISAGMLVIYLIVIHYPSTGMLKPSCMAGIDGIVSISRMRIPVQAENGSATKLLLELLARKPPHEVLFTGEQSYLEWRKAGPMASPEEQAAFDNQPSDTPEQTLTIEFPANLIYYMGLCPTDALLTQVHIEAIRAYPLQWSTGLLLSAGRMFINLPFGGNVGYSTVSLYLPYYQDLQYDSTGSRLADTLGFRKAHDSFFYSGQVVWTPGIWLFTALYEPLNVFHWLALPALVWALITRKRLYLTSALMLVTFFLIVSAFNTVQPRIYAAVYPLDDLLIGGFVAAGLYYLQRTISARKLAVGNAGDPQ